MTEEYYTETYITQWKDKDNVIISLWHYDYDSSEQVGVVELAVYKNGEHEGEALVWNLYVDEPYRRKGLARELMDEAHKTAKHLGAKVTALEWSLKESPYWVIEWYTRLGYDEKEFGPGNELMKRNTEKLSRETDQTASLSFFYKNKNKKKNDKRTSNQALVGHRRDGVLGRRTDSETMGQRATLGTVDDKGGSA